MTLLMSFVITFINVGFSELFFFQWFKAFWRAYIVAFPAILLIAPIVRKIVKKWVASS